MSDRLAAIPARDAVSMIVATLTVSANGCVIIPARIRTELGLRSGGKVVARMGDSALVLDPSALRSRGRKP